MLKFNIDRSGQTSEYGKLEDYLEAQGKETRLIVSDSGNTRVASVMQATQSFVQSVRKRHNDWVKTDAGKAANGKTVSHTDAFNLFARKEKPVAINLQQLRKFGTQMAQAIGYPGYLSDADCETLLSYGAQMYLNANPLLKASDYAIGKEVTEKAVGSQIIEEIVESSAVSA